MPGKRYTENEKQEKLKIIRRVYEGGGSVQKAGQAAGVSHQTARNWLREAGVELRETKGRNEIGYDPEDLRRLADEGLTEKEIGEKMGVSKSTAGMWLKAEGIKINLEARRAREQEEERDSGLDEKREQKKKCRTCVYRSGLSSYGCNYNLVTKKSRRCRVIGCIRYVKGKRIRLSEDFTAV